MSNSNPFSRALARVMKDINDILQIVEGSFYNRDNLSTKDLKKIRQVLDGIAAMADLDDDQEGWGLRRRIQVDPGGYAQCQIALWKPNKFGRWFVLPGFCGPSRFLQILQEMFLETLYATSSEGQHWGDAVSIIDPNEEKIG